MICAMTADRSRRSDTDPRLAEMLERACDDCIERVWRSAPGLALRLCVGPSGVVERPGRTRFDLGKRSDGWSGAVRCPTTELPFASDSFALVVLDRVWADHAERSVELLDEALRCLDREGQLLLVETNPWGWLGLRARFARTPLGAHPGALLSWMRQSGMAEIELAYGLPWPPLPAGLIARYRQPIEQVGNRVWPTLGSVYALTGRKRPSNVIPIPAGQRGRGAGILTAPGGMRRSG